MNIRDMIYNQRAELQNKIDMSRYGEEYFEDMLIEGLYDLSTDNFTIVTESIGEKFVEIKDKAIKKISELFNKFKNWILNLIRNVEVRFKSGKALIKKYKSEIENQYNKQANTLQVNYRKIVYNDVDDDFLNEFLAGVERLIDGMDDDCILNDYNLDINMSGIGKLNIIKSNGTINTESIDKFIDYKYFNNSEIKTRKLNEIIKLDRLLDILENTKKEIKELKKSLKRVKSYADETIKTIKNGGADEEYNEMGLEGDAKINYMQVEIKLYKIFITLVTFYVKKYNIRAKEVYSFSMNIVRKLLKNTAAKTEE